MASLPQNVLILSDSKVFGSASLDINEEESNAALNTSPWSRKLEEIQRLHGLLLKSAATAGCHSSFQLTVPMAPKPAQVPVWSQPLVPVPLSQNPTLGLQKDMSQKRDPNQTGNPSISSLFIIIYFPGRSAGSRAPLAAPASFQMRGPTWEPVKPWSYGTASNIRKITTCSIKLFTQKTVFRNLALQRKELLMGKAGVRSAAVHWLYFLLHQDLSSTVLLPPSSCPIFIRFGAGGLVSGWGFRQSRGRKFPGRPSR